MTKLDHAHKRSQESLAAQAEALHLFDIIAETDLQGRITYVNRKFEEISQYRAEEILGKTHAVINSGHHPKKFFQELWQTIASGRTWSGEIKNKAKDGSFYWVSTVITPVFDASKRPKSYLAIRRDITQLKNAQETLRTVEKSFSQVLENKKMLAVGLDNQGSILFCNEPFYQLTGYSRNEIIGRNWLQLFLDEKTKIEFEKVFEKTLNGQEESSDFESDILTKSKTAFIIKWLITSYQSTNGNIIGVTLIGQDITEAIKNQRELEALRLAEEKSRSDVMAFVSHEIRSPLMSLRAGIDMMRLQIEENDLDPKQITELLSRMDYQISRMDRVSRDLLRSTVFNSRSLEIHPREHSLAKLMEAVVSGIDQGELKARRLQLIVEFDFNQDAVVNWDFDRMEQAINNLLGNAIKYSKESGGHIWFRVRHLETPEVEIEIEDEGIGIPQTHQNQIFKMFSRAENALEKGERGYGLGLKITKDIIDQHCGTIHVFSREGEGSRFTVKIKLNPPFGEGTTPPN